MPTHKDLRNPNGTFKKGNVPFSKGKILEDIVGIERAKEIRQRMSISSKKRGAHLRALNENQEIMARRAKSRKYHDGIVQKINDSLRDKGQRIYSLSQYVKDAQPDIIIFKNGKLYAIELEAEKLYKASMKAIRKRKEFLHFKHTFFDKVVLIPFKENETTLEEILEVLNREVV